MPLGAGLAPEGSSTDIGKRVYRMIIHFIQFSVNLDSIIPEQGQGKVISGPTNI